MYEAPLCCEGRQVCTAVCPGHAAVEGGADVEKSRVGRLGVYVPATCTQARRARVSSRDASATGGVYEAMARATAVDGDALFREADADGRRRGAWGLVGLKCRRVPVPGWRRRFSDALETEVPSRESSRSAEAGTSVRARRRVPTLPRQLPLQGTGHGASGKGCEELEGGLDGGPAGGAHGGGAQRGGS